MRRIPLAFWGTLTMLILAGSARADLMYDLPASTCGGDSFTGTEKVGTVKDKAGDIFTLNCVNRDYFQGSVFVAATGKTTDFGRCVFDWGANIFNYEVDKNNNFTEIEWVNVKPPATTVASRNKVISDLSNTANDPTATWLANVQKYLKANNLEGNANNRIYTFPFSPNDQAIDVFQNDTLVTDQILTPDQANSDYLDNGLSPVSDLVIDPTMTIPGASFQGGTGTPEPSVVSLSALGLLAFVIFRRHAISAHLRWRRESSNCSA
ncbi:MAG: hypothetical protein JO091_02955 [Acidobacteriaceae bacterium]|nr:hypothetical protein [Acidobacteriaceae bacterium]